MNDKPGCRRILNKAFFTALLLTGSAQKSEAALLESIGSLELDQDTQGEKLLRGALKAAIAQDYEAAAPGTEELEYALSLLSPELKAVLRLPAHLRFCFILRFLARLPRNVCASLLNLEIPQLEQTATVAAQMLAGVYAEEAS